MTKENLAIQKGLAKSKRNVRLYVSRQNNPQNKKVNDNIHQSVFQHENQNFDCEMIDGETCKNKIVDDECYVEESIEDLQYTENIFSSSVHFDEKNSEDGVSTIIERRIPSFDMKSLAKIIPLYQIIQLGQIR